MKTGDDVLVHFDWEEDYKTLVEGLKKITWKRDRLYIVSLAEDFKWMSMDTIASKKIRP